MKNEDKEKIIGGVIIGAAGSVIAGKLIKDKIGKSYINTFLRSCSDFEKNAKHALSKKKIQINNRDTFNDLIIAIKNNRLLDTNDINHLKRIRDMRNCVSHGEQNKLNKNISENYSRQL